MKTFKAHQKMRGGKNYGRKERKRNTNTLSAPRSGVEGVVY